MVARLFVWVGWLGVISFLFSLPSSWCAMILYVRVEVLNMYVWCTYYIKCMLHSRVTYLCQLPAYLLMFGSLFVIYMYMYPASSQLSQIYMYVTNKLPNISRSADICTNRSLYYACLTNRCILSEPIHLLATVYVLRIMQ